MLKISLVAPGVNSTKLLEIIGLVASFSSTVEFPLVFKFQLISPSELLKMKVLLADEDKINFVLVGSVVFISLFRIMLSIELLNSK